jgi:hypothetical protein
VEIRQRAYRTGEPIPPPKHPRGAIIIDADTLARKKIDTEEALAIILKALGETGCETEQPDKITKRDTPAMQHEPTLPLQSGLPFSYDKLATLDKRYHAPLAELLSKQVWSNGELADLAERHGIKMFGGMVTAINDWAIEALDDTILIEANEGYGIDQSLLGAKG